MTDAQLNVLQRAVSLARQSQVESVAVLRRMLLDEGFRDELVDGAISHWASYVARRGI